MEIVSLSQILQVFDVAQDSVDTPAMWGDTDL